jgi:hypothetical protein
MRLKVLAPHWQFAFFFAHTSSPRPLVQHDRLIKVGIVRILFFENQVPRES